MYKFERPWPNALVDSGTKFIAESSSRVYIRSSRHQVGTELPNNPGTSVTNIAEQFAAEVISGHRLPTPLVWIVQYEDGAKDMPEDLHTSDRVMFSGCEISE